MALLSKAVLAKALWDKTTRQYRDKPTWGVYSYDRDIYPQARLAFPEYAKLYPTNEEFTKYFVRDLNNKNPQLLQKLTAGALTKEDQALIDQFNQTTAEQLAEESPPAEVAPAGASTGTATGGTTGGMGMPGVSAASSARRVYVIQQTPPPTSGMEGGTGQGTAATAKIDRLQTGTAKATASAPQEKTPSGAPSVQRVNLQGLKVPPSLANTAKNFGSSGQIFAKRNLGRLFDGLKGIASGLGRGILGPATGGLYSVGGRLGNGALDAVGRVNRPGGLGGGRMGNLSRSSNKLAFGLIGLMLFMVILGGILGGIGGTTPGEAAPLPGTADISSCKFLRSGDPVKELTYKSPLLLSYIQEAANLTGIPPVMLAAFIRVETPSTVTKNDNEIKALSSVANCPKSETGALGVMQLQPKGTVGHDEWAIVNGAKFAGLLYDNLTVEDYCDVRKNIIMGAGLILKKMTYSTPDYPQTYGDGTKWDPAWTNDKKAIEKLVNSYYGCLKYGSADDTKTPCSDPSRIYSYGDDVWTSIQNCRATAPPIPVPSGDLRQGILDRYHLDLNDPFFDTKHLTWTWNVLASAESRAPLFFTKLQDRYPIVKVRVWGGMGQRVGDTVYLSNKAGTFVASDLEKEFQQILIHELGHVIHGTREDPKFAADIEKAYNTDKTFITGYAQGSTADPNTVCASVDSGEKAVQLDEDFAESVSYYINKDTKELNYSNNCPPKNSDNPFKTQKYPAHLQMIQQILGGTF